MMIANVDVKSPQHTQPIPGDPAWDIALLFPAQGAWTEDDYLSLNTNHLIELSDGCLEVLPMPTPFHQRIAQFLFEILKNFVLANVSGEVFLAPLPIRLWSGKMREPDVCYLRPERIVDSHCPPQGADLVMEIVSEGTVNRRRDLHTKANEYARAGIQEYWIIDPQEEKVTVMTLRDQVYQLYGAFGPGTQATSVLLPGFAVDVNAIFAAAEPRQN